MNHNLQRQNKHSTYTNMTLVSARAYDVRPLFFCRMSTMLTEEWMEWLAVSGNSIPTEETRRGTGTRITSSRSHYRLPQWSVLSMCAEESGLTNAVASWGHTLKTERKRKRGGGLTRSQTRLLSIHNASCAIKINSAIMNQITGCE